MAGASAAANTEPVDYWVTGFPSDYVNPRGIPKMSFIDDAEKFLTAKEAESDAMLRDLQAKYEGYKHTENRLKWQLDTLKQKIPEIQKALEMVHFLRRQSEAGQATSAFFNIAESFYAPATVQPGAQIGLWLGADVMAEFTFEEADTLLSNNLARAEDAKAKAQEDSAWLRDQMTIAEVNIAQVWNQEVVRRRRQKEAEEKGGK